MGNPAKKLNATESLYNVYIWLDNSPFGNNASASWVVTANFVRWNRLWREWKFSTLVQLDRDNRVAGRGLRVTAGWSPLLSLSCAGHQASQHHPSHLTLNWSDQKEQIRLLHLLWPVLRPSHLLSFSNQCTWQQISSAIIAWCRIQMSLSLPSVATQLPGPTLSWSTFLLSHSITLSWVVLWAPASRSL